MDSKRRRRRRRKKKSSLPVALVFISIMLGCAAYVGYYFFLPNYEIQPFHEYFDIDDNDVTLVFGDKRLDVTDKPIEVDEALYFPYEFVKEYMDPDIYWDSARGRLTITTKDKVMRFVPGDATYYENGDPVLLDIPIYLEGGQAYLPMSFVTHVYHYDISYNAELRIVSVDPLDKERERGVISSDSARLRYKPDKKAISGHLFSIGEEVTVYAVDGEYTRVRTDVGLLGYVLTEYLTKTDHVPALPPPEPEQHNLAPIEGKINMVWDQVINLEDNAAEWRRVPHEGLDVISPTWFSFDMSLNGDIVNIADIDYVNWAHEQGYQVWPLLSDFTSDPENVQNMDISNTILADTEFRERAIEQLIGLISLYRLDGINIDFEYIQAENADNYVQFIREITPYAHKIGAYVSVDMYNPDMPDYWSQYYNRAAVGETADFICVMAYDEHVGEATGAGPNASLEFVREGLEQTIQEVPPEKVILGLPYYVRVWKDLQTNEARGMQAAYDLFQSRDAITAWDEALGAYYGEYTEDGSTYTVWLEEERSLESKLKIFDELNLAGVSGWKLGLEKDEIWLLLQTYVP
jgi:spore germination protein YaaH